MLVPELRPRVLILGGTGESLELAALAVERFAPFLRITSSLAGVTKAARRVTGEVRLGRFGGIEGLTAYLQTENVCGLIDGTHPFAATISANARIACETLGIPRLTLVRPMWEECSGDRWTQVADMSEAARVLPDLGHRAFLTVGSGGLAAFSGLDAMWFLVRLLERPDAPLPLAHHEVVIGGDDSILMAEHAIDVLVTKASGGAATEGKIIAAREIGIPVVMIRRPQLELGPVAHTLQEALDVMSNWANMR